MPVSWQIFCLLQRGRDLVRAQAAETDEGEADFAVRLGGAGARSQGAGKRQAGGGQGGGLDEIAAGLELDVHA